MLGCRLLAHCGNRRTINSAMVFMPLGQGSCPTLNLTASKNMFTTQKASPAFFVKERETINQYLHKEVTPNIPMMSESHEKSPKTENTILVFLLQRWTLICLGFMLTYQHKLQAPYNQISLALLYLLSF